MDIFDTRNFIVNKLLLEILGAWPYQSPFRNPLHAFLLCLCTSSVSWTAVLLVPHFMYTWGDLRQFTEIMTTFVTLLINITKLTNSVVRHDKMKDLLEQIKMDYDTPQDDFEAKIYKRYADRARKFSIGYAVWCHASFSLYIIGPFLSHTEGRTFPGHTKYPLDEDKYYWFIVIHQSICTFTVSAITAAVDAFFVMLVHHICAKFAVLGYNLEKIGEELSESPSAEDDLETYKKIVNCVKKHKEAISFANSMESVFSVPSFINLTMNMIVMSTSGFVILANLDSIPNLVKYIGLSVTLAVHLFFMSWPAQEMMDHSAEINEFAYFASWYRTSQRSKNLLKFLMMRSQVPCKLTAGKFYVMSLDNFSAVLKTSMSYFAVLKSLRD